MDEDALVLASMYSGMIKASIKVAKFMEENKDVMIQLDAIRAERQNIEEEYAEAIRRLAKKEQI